MLFQFMYVGMMQMGLLDAEQANGEIPTSGIASVDAETVDGDVVSLTGTWQRDGNHVTLDLDTVHSGEGPMTIELDFTAEDTLVGTGAYDIGTDVLTADLNLSRMEN